MLTSSTVAALTAALLVTLTGPVAAADAPDTSYETVVRDDFEHATSRTTTYVVAGDGTERAVSASARPTPGAHHAYVAIATTPGSFSVSVDTLKARVQSALDYWVDQSDRVISSFDLAQTATFAPSTATTANGCGLSSSSVAQQVWTEAARKFPGVSFSNGTHLIVVLPNECATGAVGLATVGDGLGSGGRVLADGESSSAPTTLVHELGHNLGLGHADAETCPSATSCATTQYADLYDPMGFSTDAGAPALSSVHRADLDLLDAAESPRVELAAGQAGASATYQLAPRASASGVRSVTAVEPGTGTVYQVDLRQPVGRDQSAWWVLRPLLSPGLAFDAGITVTSVAGGRRTLLHTRPAGGQYRTSFVPGDTFLSTRGTLSVAVVSMSSGSAEVRVGLGTSAESATQAPGPATGSAGLATFDVARPAVRGRARVGRTVRLRADAYPAGTTLTVRWLVGGHPIRGAGSTSLRLKRTLRGAVLTVRVTAKASGYAAETLTSRPVKVRG